ncbi:MAG: hypothetical protein H3C36_00020 [Chitinophagaceae bacterium]|nr:hypothetical protein [Chitinophagaceae bacterium]MCO5285683.1 hypothetical protein [Chitinophagaceae bacterium]MCW5914211.1 hypothetical protein [Chitinophagaceae bacterium]MCZ2395133.1 hypothetical protein [Chitinophagales bacterium]
MLTKEEKDFLVYWETHREKEHSLKSLLIFGAPWGLIFALPIMVVLIFHDWHKRIVPITTGQVIAISISVAAIAFFYAYFRQQVKWENNEQLYKELKIKEKKTEQKQ